VGKLIVNNIVSLDGYYADSAGNPLVLNMDAAFDRANLESIKAAGTVLLGRESYDGFSAYWPFIAEAPAPVDPNAPEARAFSAVNRDMSRRYNTIPKVVVSDRGPVTSENAWVDTTTVIPRSQASQWVIEAKQNFAEDIIVFGSRRMWTGLLARGWIDELHLMISPTGLGDGVKLFTDAAELKLIESHQFDDSSNVQLRYQVVAPSTRVDA